MAVKNGLNLFVTFLLYDDLRQAINIFRQHRNKGFGRIIVHPRQKTDRLKNNGDY
ncbi:MAG TPA: hypothetical protein VFH42_06980 [Sporolactobacillaceae bacterium]|nr:hypothetical protein [Sporolactobacillaceae bacterium]